MPKKKLIRAVAGGVLAILIAIQFVPVNRSNPPVTATPAWDSPQTAALARAACFDCHSHETTWPWYGHVAPLSWWMAHHVEEGREYFNVSVAGFGKDADEAAETVDDKEMPLWPYDWTHAGARLTPEQRVALAAGLRATFGGSHGGNGGEAGEHGEHEHGEHEH